MQLQDLLEKTCVIGLCYYDVDHSVLKQTQYAGTVVQVDAEQGISVQLSHRAVAAGQPVFILPPNLASWFRAPAGHYRHPQSGMDMRDPDYLVTWNIHRLREHSAAGQHEWWEWRPNTEAPQVGPVS